jgi:hypothetical protein
VENRFDMIRVGYDVGIELGLREGEVRLTGPGKSIGVVMTLA